jgi:DNA-binding transcriptional ArsR family regulator
MDPNEEAPVPVPAPTTPARTAQARRVVSALGDPVALAILSSLSAGDRDGHALVVQTNLPQSSIYRKLHELQEWGLVRVRRLAFTAEGRKVEVFTSRIRGVDVEFDNGRVRVRVREREDSADRIQDLWSQVRRS